MEFERAFQSLFPMEDRHGAPILWHDASTQPAAVARSRATRHSAFGRCQACGTLLIRAKDLFVDAMDAKRPRPLKAGAVSRAGSEAIRPFPLCIN
jgi:hypothetical protein